MQSWYQVINTQRTASKPPPARLVKPRTVQRKGVKSHTLRAVNEECELELCLSDVTSEQLFPSYPLPYTVISSLSTTLHQPQLWYALLHRRLDHDLASSKIKSTNISRDCDSPQHTAALCSSAPVLKQAASPLSWPAPACAAKQWHETLTPAPGRLARRWTGPARR